MDNLLKIVDNGINEGDSGTTQRKTGANWL
jgi:hypothetical protein